MPGAFLPLNPVYAALCFKLARTGAMPVAIALSHARLHSCQFIDEAGLILRRSDGQRASNTLVLHLSWIHDCKSGC